MKAINFPLSATRIPTCQSGTYPGGFSALTIMPHQLTRLETVAKSAPLEKVGRIIETEARVFILDVVLREEFVDFLELGWVGHIHRNPDEILVEIVGSLSNLIADLVRLERTFFDFIHG